MSCERIESKDFHSPEARLYTARCVDGLVRSKSFKAYTRHMAYKDRLYFTWFVVPIGLLALVYYGMAQFTDIPVPFHLLDSEEKAAHREQDAALVCMTLFVLLYLLPCVVIAPFVGFFEEPTPRQCWWALVFLTFVNVMMVSFGGSSLHYPPFLYTSPALPWRTEKLSILARVAATRVLPLQGFIVAGYLVSVWRRCYWRRMLHIPFPLLSVPLLVGLFGVASWRATSLTLPYLFAEEAGLSGAGVNILRAESWCADPEAAAKAVWSIVEAVGRVMWRDVEWVVTTRSLPTVLQDTETCCTVYLAAISIALVHFLVSALFPVISFIASGFLAVLPTHPTTWGLLLTACFSAATVLRLMEDVDRVFSVATYAMIFALLYNGFVA